LRLRRRDVKQKQMNATRTFPYVAGTSLFQSCIRYIELKIISLYFVVCSSYQKLLKIIVVDLNEMCIISSVQMFYSINLRCERCTFHCSLHVKHG
jgi:hypothetical protein